MSVGNHAIIGAAGLGVLEATTGGLGNGMVSTGVENIMSYASGAVNGALDSVDPYFSGGLVPAGLAAWALWNGSDKYSEKGIPGVVKKAAGNYGLWGTVLAAAGIASAPASAAALAVWGGLIAVEHIGAGGKEFGTDPIGKIGSVLKAPFKGFAWVANAFRGNGAAPAPATA